MARHVLIALAFAALWTNPGNATTTAAVPDPRPAHHVIDLTGSLSVDDVAAIDAAAASAAAGGELAVVLVRSVDGAVPRAWTTELFNRWRLDTAARNRGLLVMVALDDRKAEIVVGDGLMGTTQAATDRIMQDIIVANMKQGHAASAVVGAANAAVNVLAPAAAPATSPPSLIGAFLADVILLLFFGAPFLLVWLGWRAIVTTKCPSCSARARKLSTTIAAATTTSTGRKEVTVNCPKCNYTATTPIVLAMLVSDSSSSGGWDSGGGGGGDSSGGGSSGSW